VHASVGIAETAPGLTAGDVVRCADIAMYTAKDAGKHRAERFDPAQHGRIARLRMLEEHLPYAVARGELVVHYQPQVDLRTGHVHGVEALARWQHPRLGLVAPLEFIPLAERTGAIDPIGAHVLRTACAQASIWSELPGLGDLRLSVNVSARQLAAATLPETVGDALADSGLPADRLTLELTESELLEGTLAVEQLVEIVGLGVRIAIDDFGTGDASLAYLRSLPGPPGEDRPQLRPRRRRAARRRRRRPSRAARRPDARARDRRRGRRAHRAGGRPRDGGRPGRAGLPLRPPDARRRVPRVGGDGGNRRCLAAAPAPTRVVRSAKSGSTSRRGRQPGGATMAVVIPIRFAGSDPGRRDRIVQLLQDHGLDVRRGDVRGLGDLYLLRTNAGLAERGAITDLLERHVPGWQAAAEFYWPE
jgi:EAL domain